GLWRRDPAGSRPIQQVGVMADEVTSGPGGAGGVKTGPGASGAGSTGGTSSSTSFRNSPAGLAGPAPGFAELLSDPALAARRFHAAAGLALYEADAPARHLF